MPNVSHKIRHMAVVAGLITALPLAISVLVMPHLDYASCCVPTLCKLPGGDVPFEQRPPKISASRAPWCTFPDSAAFGYDTMDCRDPANYDCTLKKTKKINDASSCYAARSPAWGLAVSAGAFQIVYCFMLSIAICALSNEDQMDKSRPFFFVLICFQTLIMALSLAAAVLVGKNELYAKSTRKCAGGCSQVCNVTALTYFTNPSGTVALLVVNILLMMLHVCGVSMLNIMGGDYDGRPLARPTKRPPAVAAPSKPSATTAQLAAPSNPISAGGNSDFGHYPDDKTGLYGGVGGGGGGGGGGLQDPLLGSSSSEPYRDRLRAMYKHYNVVRSDHDIATALQKYKGMEEQMMSKLVQKYGPEPTPPPSVVSPRPEDVDVL